MAYDLPPPDQRPESGYYYHFQHGPAGPLNNYAYYIYGVGHHTEDDCRTEDSFMQVYRREFLRLPERRSVRPPTAVHVLQARHPRGERGAPLHEDHRSGNHRRTAGNQEAHVWRPITAGSIRSARSRSFSAGQWSCPRVKDTPAS